MKLEYQELPEYQFPYWIDFEEPQFTHDFNRILDINQWCGEQFGDLGVSWGYFRETKDNNTSVNYGPNGPNPVRARLNTRTIHFSWRFKNKADAMAFKLTWGGA